MPANGSGQAQPTIEGHLGSVGLLPRVPFFKLLFSAPDGVTGGATLAGMQLDVQRLCQLAPEAKLITHKAHTAKSHGL